MLPAGPRSPVLVSSTDLHHKLYLSHDFVHGKSSAKATGQLLPSISLCYVKDASACSWGLGAPRLAPLEPDSAHKTILVRKISAARAQAAPSRDARRRVMTLTSFSVPSPPSLCCSVSDRLFKVFRMSPMPSGASAWVARPLPASSFRVG